MAEDRIRVVIVEDEDLFRELLTSSLSQSSKVEVIGSYSDGETALHNLTKDAPDVAVLDIDLGMGETGVQVGLRMRRILQDVGIVLLSNYDEPGVLSTIGRAEVSGWSYLLKKSVSNVGTIIRAIDGTRAHLVVLDPHLVRALHLNPRGRMAALTPRQREVLGLIAQGYSNAAIAAELVLQPKSVENTVSQIYQGLGIDSTESSLHARVKATLVFLEESRR